MISSQKKKNVRVQVSEDINLTLHISDIRSAVVLDFDDNNIIPFRVNTSEEIYVEIDALYKVEVPTSEFEYYDGIYEVTPMTTSQTLYTREKMMRYNVLIHTIPTEEKLNAAGGYTFTIGGD